MPETTRTCPTCGKPVSASFPEGLCPACLLSDATAPFAKDPGQPRADSPATSRPATASPGPAPRVSSRVPTVEALQPWFPGIEILELLGAGGMGAVYKARQPRLNRLVALKVLLCPPEWYDNFVLRFEMEAQVMARLSHPHIVTIHDFGEIDRSAAGLDTLFYFLMEYVDGTDLNHLIRSGDLPPQRGLALVPQICDALQFAHDEGFTHRDIKPANLLVDKKGVVKIADFGLAKLIRGDETLAMGLTVTGTSLGTPHYMAPEVWETPETVDHRADIYSLGVVLYEMLTGERPAGVFDPPSRKVTVDPRVDAVVFRAMERDPARRYQQAREIRDALARIGEKPTPPAPRSRRGIIVGSLVGLAGAAALAGLAVAIFHPFGWWDGLPDPISVGLDQKPASSSTLTDRVETPPSTPAAPAPSPVRAIPLAADSSPPAWLTDGLATLGGDIVSLAGWSNPFGADDAPSEESLLAIRADGTVACLIAPDNPLASAGLSDWCAQITVAQSAVVTAAGVAVLRRDGSVMTRGLASWGTPAGPALRGPYTQLAGGHQHVAALRADGTVLAWGDNRSGQVTPPPGLADVESLRCGHLFTIARHRDGSLTTWGLSGAKEITPPQLAPGDLLDWAAVRNGVYLLHPRGEMSAFGWRPGGDTWPQIRPGSDAVALAAQGDYLAVRTADGQWRLWSGIERGSLRPYPGGPILRGARSLCWVGGCVVAIAP
ncbi:MAG: protein kinase [Verrucomicrobiales bacterium]|nr:protein kinase [Verrucomicrobiales bacterium]